MAEHYIRMAKATPKDIDGMLQFFRIMEILFPKWGDFDPDDYDEDDEDWKAMKPYMKGGYCEPEEGNDFNYADFVSHFIQRKLCGGDMRVIYAADILINGVCDPQENYLKYSPYLEEMHVAPEQ